MSLFIYSNTPSVIFLSNHYQHKHAKRLTMIWVDAWYERFTRITKIHDVMKQQNWFWIWYFYIIMHFDKFDLNHERVKIGFLLDWKCILNKFRNSVMQHLYYMVIPTFFIMQWKSAYIINRWFITCRYQISNEFTTAIYRCKNVV